MNAMTMPLLKTAPATAVAPAVAQVVTFEPKRPALAVRLKTKAGQLGAHVIPPVLVIALALLIWELLCRKAGSTLPPPSKVLDDTWELIVDPFFDRGGLDKGLF